MGGFRGLLWDRGSLVGIEHLYCSKQFFFQVFILQLRETNKQTNPVQIFSFWKKKVGGKNQGLTRFRCWGLGGTSAGGQLPGWAEGKGEMVEFEVRRQELLLLPCLLLAVRQQLSPEPQCSPLQSGVVERFTWHPTEWLRG